MNTKNRFIHVLSLVAALSCTINSRAGIFTWSPPAAITSAEATLTQSGTIVGAAVFGADSKLVFLTNGTTVDFKADSSVAFVSVGSSGGTAYGGFTNNTGNAAFNAALTQFNFDNGPKTITVNGLEIGQLYSVQLFALDRRDANAAARTANYQDPADAGNVSATIQMGDNVYVIGTFTATATTVDIQENLLNAGAGNINALVLRAIGTNVPPQITTQPQPANIYNSFPAKLTVGALGTGPLSYQWQRGPVGGGTFTNVPNGGNISGATSNTLAFAALTAGDEADYQVIVTNSAGSVTSSPVATLTVVAGTPQFVWAAPALITTADATLTQTGSVVGAVVFGTSQKIVVLGNGSSIDFKTDGVVATATGAGTTAGAFSGNTGNANFNAVLNQFNYDNGPKTITLNDLVMGEQYSVQLFALDNRLGGGGGATARFANFQDPGDAADVSTTFQMGDNVYTIGTFTAAGPSVAIQENLPTGGGGNINALVLRRLTGLPVAPQITTQPNSVNASAGGFAQLTVGANGTALTYQWQRAAVGSGVFSNVSGGNATGANTAQLTFTNLNSGNAADYRVIVSNAAGSVTSSPAATLNVALSLALAHRWSFSEASGTTAVDSIGGANGTLQGGANFGGGFVALPNSDLPNANSYVSIPGGLLKNFSSVSIECWVTNNGWNNGNTFVGFGGPIDPSGAGTNFIDFFARWLVIVNPASAFQIQTFAGNSGVVDLGTRVNYNSAVVGPTPAHYAFLYDPNVGSVALYTNGVLSGTATGVTIPLSTVDTNLGTIGYAVWNTNLNASIPGTSGNRPFINAGFSEVRIFNGILSSNRIVDSFKLGPDVVPTAPQITSQPQSASVFAGANVQFTVGATGAPLNFQFQRAATGSGVFTNVVNGGNVSGANTNQLTLTGVGSGDVADFRVIISNGSGSVTSTVASLTILSSPALAHRWSFSEVSGTTAADSIGGANGTLQGGAFFAGGYAVLPNAGAATDTSYVSIPGGLLKTFPSVTVECWVTNNGWANGNTFVGFAGPTSASGSGTNYISFFARWFNAISAFEITNTTTGSGIVNLGPRVNYNSATTPPTPAHYAYTYDPGAGTVALYTNGVFSGTASGVTIPLSTVGTNLGTIGRAVWNTNFAANIDFTSGNRPFMNAGFSEVRIHKGVLNSNAIAASFLVGPNQLLSNNATLSVSNNAGSITLSWPLVNGAFSLETSPVLGAGAVWTPVTAGKSVVGSNYQVTVQTTNSAAFFRLKN